MQSNKNNTYVRVNDATNHYFIPSCSSFSMLFFFICKMGIVISVLESYTAKRDICHKYNNSTHVHFLLSPFLPLQHFPKTQINVEKSQGLSFF